MSVDVLRQVVWRRVELVSVSWREGDVTVDGDVTLGGDVVTIGGEVAEW